MSPSHSEFGPLVYKVKQFGLSAKGLPLELIETASINPQILVVGSIHGDESLTTVLLSESLRSLGDQELRVNVVLAANPDGVLAGTRCNASGVDLNRNFPATNWSAEPVYYRNRPGDPQNIALSPGSKKGSEPETLALIELVESLKPQLIVSLHGFLACIDDPHASSIAKDMAERTGMELVPDVGYATPGSFGSWCKERGIPIITYELPASSITETKLKHLPVLRDLLAGHYNRLLN
jgi:murein peptide amidase A